MAADTSKFLATFAAGLKLAGASSASSILNNVANTLCRDDWDTISKLGKLGLIVEELRPDQDHWDTSENKLAVDQLSNVVQMLRMANGDVELINSLDSLKLLLQRFSDSPKLAETFSRLRDFMTGSTEALYAALVSDFSSRLKRDMYTSAFEQTISELLNSKLKKEHVVEIAQIVVGGTKSKSRPKALEAIRKPHDAYLNTKRGIDASGGRSAA